MHQCLLILSCLSTQVIISVRTQKIADKRYIYRYIGIYDVMQFIYYYNHQYLPGKHIYEWINVRYQSFKTISFSQLVLVGFLKSVFVSCFCVLCLCLCCVCVVFLCRVFVSCFCVVFLYRVFVFVSCFSVLFISLLFLSCISNGVLLTDTIKI